MKLSMKNVKYFKEGSKETPNFVADLYDNGIHVATVKNDGWGGPNFVTPINGGKYDSVRKYDNLDVESEIFGLINDYDAVTKHQSNSLVVKKGDEILRCKFSVSIAKMKEIDKGIAFLNKTIQEYQSKGYVIMNRNL